MRKTLITLFLALVASVGTLFAVSGSCGSGVSWNFNTKTGVLKITGSGDMANFKSWDAQPWYEYMDQIYTISIADGVTSVGDYAFCYASALESVTLGTKIKTIGKEAFNSCESLSAITLPESLTIIGTSAFYGCSLTSIQLPSNLTTISEEAFYACPISGDLIIPNSVTTIGKFAFYSINATSITIGENVITIGEGAFRDWNCQKLIFNAINCADFVSQGWDTFFLLDYAPEDEDNYYHPFEIEIGAKVKRIPAYFAKPIVNAEWKTPEKATSLLEIGAWAMAGVTNSSLQLPPSLKFIGENAFSSCSNLENVQFPNTLESIGKGAFSYAALNSLTLPSAITRIEEATFRGCKITTLTIPEQIEYIGPYAFAFDRELGATIYYNAIACDTVNNWLGTTADVDPIKLQALYIGNKVKTIPYGFTYDGKIRSAQQITIPDNVETIRSYAFRKCNNLPAKLILPKNLKIIEQSAFDLCPIDTLVLPEGLQFIGDYAFQKYAMDTAPVVYVSTLTPPVLGKYVFNATFGNVVYVPYELRDAYLSNEQWNVFKLIFTKEDGTIIVYGNCGSNVKWEYNQKDSLLVISGNGEVDNYTIKSGVYTTPYEEYRLAIKKIVIEDGITKGGNYAFAGFSNLNEAIIGKDCSQFGTLPFGASQLERLTCYTAMIPKGIGSSFNNVMKVIPAEAYGSWISPGNTDLNFFEFIYSKDEYSGSCGGKLTWTANIKEGTLDISGTGDMETYQAPYKRLYTPFLNYIHSISLSDEQTSISSYSFTQMNNLRMTELTLPPTLTSIGNYAFPDAASTGLKSVYPQGATPPTLRSSTVFGAVEDFKVYLPFENYAAYKKANYWKQMQLELIPQDVYSGSIGDSIQWSVIAKDSTLVLDGQGIVPDLNNHPWAYLEGVIKTVIIKEGIRGISIVFGTSTYDISVVKNYSPYLFVEQGAYSNGYVAEEAQEVYNYAIYSGSCGENLTWTFNAEDSLFTIKGTGAMNNATSWSTYKKYIKTIHLSDEITSISAYAFSNCSNLSVISLPASLETIENEAFKECSNLKTVYNYSPYIVVVKGDYKNGMVAYYADEVFNMVEEYTGSCGEDLMWTFSTKDSVLTISGKGTMTNYTYYGETPWYALSPYIKTAVIGAGVTSLSQSAFPSIHNPYYDSNENMNYSIPQIVHNYSSVYCQKGSGNNPAVYYIYYAKEVHNYYTFTGTCNNTITWSLTYGTLTVSGTGELNYSSYNFTPWYNYSIDTVIIHVDDVYVSDVLFPQSAQIIIGENVKRITIGLGFDKVKALSKKNSISKLSTIAPADKDYVYDLDGDGEMDFVSGVHAYSYLGIDKGELFDNYSHYYDNYGKETSSAFYPFNANNDGLIDFYHNSEVYVYNEAYKSEVCESNGGAYKNTPIAIDYQSRIVLLDANLDGRMDFYSCEGNYDHFIHYRQPDGSYLKAKMQIITDTTGLDDTMKQWMYASDYIQGTYYVDGGLFGPQARPGIFQSIDKTVDANHDGLIDLMSSTEGSLLINLGNNRFIPAKSSGQMTARDFNGDGHSDYIIFDEITKTVSVQFFEGNGNYKTQVLWQNDNINHIWCYDFDNDGDVDVLLPLDWNETSGYAFLVFFRNEGNNTFKKVENAFDEPVRHFRFMDCKDVDNDGKYEIIAADSIINTVKVTKGDYYIVRYNDQFKVSVDAEPFIKNSIGISYGDAYGIDNQFLLADFNNDGKLDYWYSYDNYNALNHFSPNKVNTPPTKMNKPAVIYDEDRKMLKVSWDRGSDAESPTLDLTYNLRIGTKSGDGDIWFAAANADGSQRSILGGNAGDNLSQWVNTEGLATGDYYIAVQAVDPNNLGGAWSDEQVYHHTLISSQFEISNYEVTTTDTLLVQLSAPVNKDFTYNWNFGDDAVVLSQEGQNYKIAYNTSGVKTICLQVNAPSGVSSLITKRTVRVFPVRFEYVDDNNYYKYSYFDMNMDGTIDRLMSESGGGFYRGDGSGTFTKLAKTYNTDLNPEGHGAMCFIDYNMDGLPDVLRSTNKGNLMLNENDYDLTFETHDFVRAYKSGNTYYSSQMDFTYYRSERSKDFNGDGYLDYYYNYTSGDGWLNYGYYLYGEDINGEATDKWTAFDRLHSDMEMPRYSADLNNDGLEDVLIYIYEDKMYCYDIYLQQTDGSFRKHGRVVLSDWTGKIEIADFNNDGFLDFIIKKDNRSTITVFFGDKNSSYSQTIDIHIPELESKKGDLLSVSAIEDIDNNGYIDLLITLGDWVEGSGQYLGGYDYEYMIIYMHPDYNILCQSAPTAADNLKYPFFDLNGDNVPDYNNYLMHSRITNDAPAVPKNLRMTEENGAVKLMWDAAVDKETPAAQMRYNISVKKKGAKVGEENAFIISPMNGLNDEATVIPDYPYKRGTQTYIPYRRFEVGQEYEFQIQAIDAWNAHSPISAPITFTVQKNTTYNPDSPTGVEDVQGNNLRCAKVFRDGILYIECNGKVYSITGQKVR